MFFQGHGKTKLKLLWTGLTNNSNITPSLHLHKNFLHWLSYKVNLYSLWHYSTFELPPMYRVSHLFVFTASTFLTSGRTLRTDTSFIHSSINWYIHPFRHSSISSCIQKIFWGSWADQLRLIMNTWSLKSITYK